MFIVVGMDAKNDVVSILDTKENVAPSRISLYSLAHCITHNNLVVKGLPKTSAASKNAIEIPNIGVSFDITQAKEALAKYFVMNGLFKAEARERAGLV